MNVVSESCVCRMTWCRSDGTKKCYFLVRNASMGHLVNALQHILGSVTEEQHDDPLVRYSRITGRAKRRKR